MSELSKRVKLTNQQILMLADGLCALDGILGPDGKGIVRFKFDAAIALQIAQNLVAVEEALKAYRRARAAGAASRKVVDKMPLTEATAAAIADFLNFESLLKDEEQEVQLHTFRLDVLQQQAEGRIPPSAIARLMPVLKVA